MNWTRTTTEHGAEYAAGDPAECRFEIVTYEGRKYFACAHDGYHHVARYVPLGEYRTLRDAKAAAERYGATRTA